MLLLRRGSKRTQQVQKALPDLWAGTMILKCRKCKYEGDMKPRGDYTTLFVCPECNELVGRYEKQNQK